MLCNLMHKGFCILRVKPDMSVKLSMPMVFMVVMTVFIMPMVFMIIMTVFIMPMVFMIIMTVFVMTVFIMTVKCAPLPQRQSAQTMTIQ